MRTRHVILAVLALAGLVARIVIGLPGAFGIVGSIAIVGLPLALAFMVADAWPWRRNAFIASAVAAVGLPVALQPQWGWVASLVVLVVQAVALWRPGGAPAATAG